jgi:hypothetical protein
LAARQFLVLRPVSGYEITGQASHQLDEENPDLPESRRAVTRLAEPNVNLIVLYELAGRTYLDAAGREPFDVNRRIPTLEDAQRLLRNAVSIQHRGCVAFYAAVQPPATWGKSGLLRYSRLVRVGGDGAAVAGEYQRFRVDPELGVSFSPAPA